MKEGRLILAGLLLSLCISACGTNEAVSSDESDHTQAESMVGGEKKRSDTAAKQENPEANFNTHVLTAGGPVFTHMTVLKNDNYPDGSYYYEDMTEDTYTTVINCAYLSMREDGESMEDYAARDTTRLSDYEARDFFVEKNDAYSENLGYSVYVMSYTAGTNEDTRYWKVFMTEAYGYTYLYAFNVWGEIYEDWEMEETIDDVFSRLFFLETKQSGKDSNVAGITLQDIRTQAKERGYVCAAASLGCGDDISALLAQLDLEKYPFLRDIPKECYVEHPEGGTEIYCIIPTDPAASLAVNTWVMDETNGYYGETGEILYRSESGEPILLRTNPSDAVPGTQVIIVDNQGNSLDWNPALSLYDGTMTVPGSLNGVMDFTDYSSQPFRMVVIQGKGQK